MSFRAVLKWPWVRVWKQNAGRAERVLITGHQTQPCETGLAIGSPQLHCFFHFRPAEIVRVATPFRRFAVELSRSPAAIPFGQSSRAPGQHREVLGGEDVPDGVAASSPAAAGARRATRVVPSICWWC